MTTLAAVPARVRHEPPEATQTRYSGAGSGEGPAQSILLEA